ncbi:MAG: extracellular solute-binding protein [Victivallaceae bacterium]
MKKEYMPLYMRIKSDIINKITAGELKKGDRLPPERVLAEEFGVSRVTIVGALAELEREGIIRKIQGSGSYIDTELLAEDYSDIFRHITSKPKTEISFGVFKPSIQYEFTIKTLARVFQLENPDIRVRVETVTPENCEAEEDIYLLKIGSGKAPAVGEFFLHADYAAINGLMPLENMPGFAELAKSLYPQCCYRTRDASGEDHVHALASKINTRIVLANVDLLHAAGIRNVETLPDIQTLTEWVEKLGEYTRKQNREYYGVFMDVPTGWHGVIGNFPYWWSCREKPDENYSLQAYTDFIAGADCCRGFDVLAGFYARGNPAPVYGAELFALGRVGLALMTGCWPLTLNELMPVRVNVRAYQIPSEQAGAPAVSVMGNYSLGIFRSAVKTDAELEAAWKWIKFLFRKQQQFLQTSDYFFPAVKKIPNALWESHPEIAGVFEESLARSNPQFDFRNIRRALAVTGDEYRKCLLSGQPGRQCTGRILEQLRNL